MKRFKEMLVEGKVPPEVERSYDKANTLATSFVGDLLKKYPELKVLEIKMNKDTLFPVPKSKSYLLSWKGEKWLYVFAMRDDRDLEKNPGNDYPKAIVSIGYHGLSKVRMDQNKMFTVLEKVSDQQRRKGGITDKNMLFKFVDALIKTMRK